MTHKTVFISYSWDSKHHKEWVLNFANDLVKGGVDVILDQYELSAGKEMTHFMEKSVGADKIIMVMTPNYKLKADKRQGGVGYEYSLITQEYYDKQTDKTKILPLLRQGDKDSSSPAYMRTKLYHPMADDKMYDTRLFELIKLIHDNPLVTKPELGKVPNFDAPTIPDIDKKLIDFNAQEELEAKKYAIVNNQAGVKLFQVETDKIFKNIGDNVNHYKNNLKFYLTTKVNAYQKSYFISTINYTYFFAPHLNYNNSVSDAYITMNFFIGPVGLDDMMIDYYGKKESIYLRKYMFKLDDTLNPIWVNQDDQSDRLQTNDIHSLMFREVINHEIDLRNKNKNN
jgi:hypothetical protein